MSNIRYILRLHTQNVGAFEIIRQTGIPRSILRTYLTDFKKSGLTFEEINELTDQDLADLFHKPDDKPVNPRLQILLKLFPAIEKELKGKGVTRKLLWEEYMKRHPDGYEYARFNQYFVQWVKKPVPVLHKEHRPGDKMYIDFAGQKLSVMDIQTNTVKRVEVFVAILGASQFTYVEAVNSQQKEDFILSCENALQFFGGVPSAIVCDNLRAAVKRANRYEPTINNTFADFGEHYSTAIIPTRPNKPTDKALVEGAINIIYTRIYTKVRAHTFYSLEELNKAIREELKEHNNQQLTGRPYSRYQQFKEIEEPALLPLPLLRYEFKKQSYRNVGRNSHVCLSVDKHYYSVPHEYIGKCVKVLYSSQQVDIFYSFERIASYKRDRTAYTYTTNNSHLLPAHRFTIELSSDRFLAQAADIHPEVRNYLSKVLEITRHKEQAYGMCTGILGFAKKVGAERLTRACRRATNCGLFNYRSIRKILEQGLDMLSDLEDIPLKMPEHDNIRGKEYYQ